jgi:hypothetical protein
MRAHLRSLRRGDAGDPLTQLPWEITFDLSALAGRTVRIRIAETDNANFFSAALDDVRIDSAPIAAPAPAPDPTTPDPTTSDPTARDDGARGHASLMHLAA